MNPTNEMNASATQPGARPMTLTEKIIARAAGSESVRPGDEVWVTADRMIMNDSSGPRRIAGLVEELGGVWDPSRVVLVSDHFVPASNVRHAEILRTSRKWAGDNEIMGFAEYDGILHNLVLERGWVEPGMLLVGADSHTTTAGAVGAVAVAVGSTELATVLATGQMWMCVPEAMEVELVGRLGDLCDARDITLSLLSEIGTSRALYRAIEYKGACAAGLDLEARSVLANQGIEMGAKNAMVIPSEEFCQSLGGGDVLVPDAGAEYEERRRIDLSALVPLVASPPSPDQVAPAADIKNVEVDMAWLGSCAGGRGADLRAAARVLAGRTTRVPTLATPATREIYRQCLEDGTLGTLIAAGVTVLPPGCGACAGIHNGVQGAGDRVIATATRNFPGRMGSREAGVYLGSGYTVAASAATGRITDPRELSC